MIHIDVFTISSFIILSLILGLDTFKKYGVEDKNPRTSTLAVNILGIISGNMFLFHLVECYEDGLYHIFPFFLSLLSTLCISWFVAPRMKEFLNHHSIAESMNVLFGNKVGIITAFFGIWICMKAIILQFIGISNVANIYLSLDSQYFIYEIFGITLLYIFIKHMKATSLTNCIQLFFFTPLLPIVLCLVSVLIYSPMKSDRIYTLLTHENFDMQKIIGCHPKFGMMLNLSFLYIIPKMNPAIVQRIYSASNVWQIRKVFNYVTLIALIMISLVSLLVISLRAGNIHLDSQKLIYYLISIQLSLLLKELICIGIFASAIRMIDVYFNTISVLFTHDIAPFFKVLCDNKSKLAATKICIITTGIVGSLIELYQKNLLYFSIVIPFQSVYSVVSIPFLMALFGFRPRSQSVLLGIGAGCITILLLKICSLEPYFGKKSNDVCVLLVEVFVLISSHYWLLKKSHIGWVGIKEKLPLLLDQQEKREARRKLIYSAIESNLLSPKRIFYLYGIYMLCTHGMTWYCIAIPSYYDICYHIGALLWGIFFIGYAWYPVPDKTMTSWVISLWFGGLIVFLFITGPLNCILHKYDPLWCIILFTNFTMAYLLWPLSFVISMTLGNLFCTILCICYHITELSSPSWQGDYTILILGCTAITSILLLHIKTQKVIVHQRLKCKYIEELQTVQKLCQLQTLQVHQHMHYLLARSHYTKLDNLFPNMELFFKLYHRITNKERQKEYLYKLRQIYEIPQFLQERYYYDQEFLPLDIEAITLTVLMREIRNISKALEYKNKILFNTPLSISLYGDKKQLRQLLVSSMEYLETKNTKCNIIKFGMMHTTLQYELKISFKRRSIKTIPALAMYLTTDHSQEPDIASYYQGNLGRPNFAALKDITNLAQWENERIIDAHYGYITTMESDKGNTLLYVIPLDLRQIRNETMDQLSHSTELFYETEYSNVLEVALQEAIEKQQIFSLSAIDLKEVLSFIKKCHDHATRCYTKEPLYTFSMSMALELLNITQQPDLILTALLYGTVEVANLPLSYIKCKYGYKVSSLLTQFTNITQDCKKVACKTFSPYSPLDMDEDDNEIGKLKLAKRVVQLRSEIAYETEEIRKVFIKETLLSYVPFSKKINCLTLASEIEQICTSLEGNFLEWVEENKYTHSSLSCFI